MSNLNPDTLVQPSPASEQSVYFDAPIMHFRTESDEDSTDAGNLTNAEPDPPESQLERPLDAGASDTLHQQSVTTAVDPVLNRRLTKSRQKDFARPAGDDQSSNGTKTPRGVSPGPAPDSGYDSSATDRGRQRSVSRTRRKNGDRPIPILWTDDASPSRRTATDDTDGNSHELRSAGSQTRRAASLRSFRSTVDRARDRNSAHGREYDSVRSTSTSRYSQPRRHVSLTGGSFAAGAGTIGPASSPRPEDTAGFHARSKSVDAELTPKQRSKIEKANAKEGKRVAKVIKAEAKAEKAAIEQAIRELADIQKMQKAAIKEEVKAVSAHAKALRAFHKEEMEFLTARTKYEKAQAEMQAWEDAREAARQHAAEVTEMLQEKNQEVEWLRAQKAADDREREAKLKQLTGKA